VVGVPGSLADISALEFGFADPVAAQAYLHATGSTQPCLVTMPDGGQFQPVAYLETNDGIYEANGGTKYPSGPYEGAYKWSVIEYAAQGPDVFVVSINTINGYTNDILPDVVLTTMEQPGGPNLIESPRSAHPGTIQAELVKAPYSLDVTPPPFGIDRTLNVSQFTNCPEAQIGTVLYNVIFENQMLNAGAAGVVVPGPGPQGTATVAWGSPVTLTVDSYGTNENESTFGCGGAHDSFNDNYVNVESMAAG
jgi:hypothetical protein